MDLGVVFSPLPGPPVGVTRPFSDWMRAAESCRLRVEVFAPVTLLACIDG